MVYKKKWKYQSKFEKSNVYDEYLILPKDKKYIIKIKNWEYPLRTIDGETKTVFITDVFEANGKKVDKTFLISNYENLQFLKKKLKKKKEFTLDITRRYDDDTMEIYFDIEVM